MFRARRLPTRVLHITDSEGSRVFFKTIKNNSIVVFESFSEGEDTYV